MTTNEMGCELFNEQLMAYLERETDDATSAAVERHALSCAECGALLADLRKLRIDAANLPGMQPSRDLWAGIASRIEAPVVSINEHLQFVPEKHTDVVVGFGGVVRSLDVRRWVRGASVAAGLVLAAGVGYFARGTTAPVADTVVTVVDAAPDTVIQLVEAPESASSSTRSPAIAPAMGGSGAMPVATNASRPVEVQNAARVVVATLAADYDREIARLQRLIDERRNQLDPVTVGIIEKNLKVIDTAIAECKKAISNDPASGFLIESLNQSLRSKVELMRTAALLPSRT